MEFEELDLTARRRIGLSARQQFEAALAEEDQRGTPHHQRLINRVREPEIAIYGQVDRAIARKFD